MAELYEVAAVDMDGVLVDFISGAMRVNGGQYDRATYPRLEWEIARVLGITTEQFWRAIDATPLFWPRLQAYDWLAELLRIIHEVADTVVLLSTAGWHPDSHSGKRIWVDEYIRPLYPDMDLCLVRKKWLMARPGRLLIDDNDTNVESWREHGGDAILFPQPWNKNHALCHIPMDHVRWELQEKLARELEPWLTQPLTS